MAPAKQARRVRDIAMTSIKLAKRIRYRIIASANWLLRILLIVMASAKLARRIRAIVIASAKLVKRIRYRIIASAN
jgi:hypothetical protein